MSNGHSISFEVLKSGYTGLALDFMTILVIFMAFLAILVNFDQFF